MAMLVLVPVVMLVLEITEKSEDVYPGEVSEEYFVLYGLWYAAMAH